MRLGLVATLSVLAAASPAPNGYGFCATVSKQVGYMGQQSPVISYCSSYLSIPVYTKTAKKSVTTTVTKTEASPGCSTTVPQQTKTVTIQTGKIVATTTFSTTSTINDISTSTSTTTIVECQVPFARSDGREKKRNAPQNYNSPKPAALSAYKDKKAISSACSCLSIPTSNTTIYKGATTCTTTITITKGGGKGTVPTISPQVTITSIITTDSTSSTTTTFTTRLTGLTSTTTSINAIQTPPGFSIGAWDAGVLDGYYFTTNQLDTDAVISFKSLAEDRVPSRFELMQDGVLREANYKTLLLGTSSDEPPRLKWVDESGSDFACSIQIRDDYMCQLNCQRGGTRQVNYICEDQAWKIVNTGSLVPEGCVAFTPLVVPRADQQK